MIEWNDARIADLARLWDAGLTATQIAKQIGTTRSAILGKRKRLGLPERLREGPPPPQRPKRLYARRYPAIRYREPPPKSVAPTLDEKRCTLLELDATRCRWPNGEPEDADFYFCGGAIERGSYCTFHHGLSIQKRTPSTAPVNFNIRRGAMA